MLRIAWRRAWLTSVSWAMTCLVSCAALWADQPSVASVNLIIGRSPSIGSTPNCPNEADLERQLKPIADISLDVLSRPEPAPLDCFVGEEPIRALNHRGHAEYPYAWCASGLFHAPLYFEDTALERYGQKCFPQPLWSGARFFGTVPLLPYKIGLEHGQGRRYRLGYARPGDWTPPVRERLPFSLKGAALEAAAATGIVFLFP